MNKNKIIGLPMNFELIVSGPKIIVEGGNAKLSMEFDDDGKDVPFEIEFVKQRAIKKLSEIYCSAWHVEETFDTLCEVVGSDWVKELSMIASDRGAGEWILRNFIIFLDGFGCFEVICESVNIN